MIKELPTLAAALFGAMLMTTMSSHAYEQAFPPTEPGTVEVKALPALVAIVNASAAADYFEAGGDLFMPLFRYIQERDIAMTTPVESSMEPVSMSFYIGDDARKDALEPEGPVQVRELPERLVLAVGMRGAYSKANYEKALRQARTWLDGQHTYEALGTPPRMIYWNGPYVPWFLKKSELHLDVRKTP